MAEESKAYLVLLGHREEVGDPAHIRQLGTATDTFQVQHRQYYTPAHNRWQACMCFTALNVTMYKQTAQTVQTEGVVGQTGARFN